MNVSECIDYSLAELYRAKRILILSVTLFVFKSIYIKKNTFQCGRILFSIFIYKNNYYIS